MRAINQRPVMAVVLVALLALAAPSLRAQSGASSSKIDATDDEFIHFVGRYGEVLKLRKGYVIQPSMHGAVEVINYHSEARSAFSESIERFHPRPEEFIPENFTRYALIQLIVMPWSESSSKSLGELKRLKIADLRASGVGFVLIEDPHFPEIYGRWPEGSFEVRVSTPYRLSQLYTASSSHLCILTSGRDTPPSTVIGSYYSWMRSSLARWIVPQEPLKEMLADSSAPRSAWKNQISLRVFTRPDIWVTWAILSGICFVLTGFLMFFGRGAAIRRACLYIMLFSHAGAVIGALVGLVLFPFEWFGRHLPISFAVACLFMPLLAWIVGRVRGGKESRRGSAGVTAWASAATVFLAYCGSWDWGDGFSPHVPAFTSVVAFAFYAIAGLIFAALDALGGRNSGSRALWAFVLLVAASSRAAGQATAVPIEKSRPNSIDGDASFVARANLAAKQITPESAVKDAENILRKTRVIYKYQRVEIKGIWSKSDTNDAYRDLFDKQIEPSHIGDSDNSRVIQLPDWMRRIRDYGKDLSELHQDAYQQLSGSAEKTVKELAGQEVNEIVAHSWGTEIVYNAILAGKILPPRRLIVAGMPDRDLEKWKALSKYTGTEVIVYANESDPVAETARFGGGMTENLGRLVLPGVGALKEVPSPFAPPFEAQWEAACRKFDCNPHGRQAAPPTFDHKYDGGTHDRLAYYEAMLNDGTIPLEASDARKLGERQKAMIDAKASQLYAAALDDEISRITGREAARAGGEASFLQGISRIAPISRQARDTFVVQEAAARAAWERDPEYLAYKTRSDEYRRKRDETDQIEYEKSRAERERQVEHWADMKRRWRYLLETTGVACSNPDALEQQARQGNVPGVSLSDLDLAWQMNRIETVGMKDRPVANECQKYILAAIRGSSGLVSGNEILVWSRRYRKEHPTLVGRFTTTLTDFFSAMGEAFQGDPSSPRERSNGAAQGGPITREPAERPQPETRERETRHSPDDWSSLRQLRGFKGF